MRGEPGDSLTPGPRATPSCPEVFDHGLGAGRPYEINRMKLADLCRRMLDAWDAATATLDTQIAAPRRNALWRDWSRAQKVLDDHAGRHVPTHEARAILGHDVATETLTNSELA